MARVLAVRRFLFLFLLALSAACNEAPPQASVPAPAATTPVPTSPPPTATPTSEPQPSPTVEVTGLLIDSESQSDWRPPTIEDTLIDDTAMGGQLPEALQSFIAQAQATVGNSGFPEAVVQYADNGLSGDDFRAAFPLRGSNGEWYWADGSAFPSQMGLDGSIRSGVYNKVQGSQDARLDWNPGVGGGHETEPTLVKHKVDLPDGGQAALLYWHPLENVWKPVEGYQVFETFVVAGGKVYQFSSQDGSTVELAGIFGMVVSLETDDGGRVIITDDQGTVFWLNEGRFVNDALLKAEAIAAEAQKVVEYVEANSEVINRVPMEHVEFRATDALQRQIYDRLPTELQTKLGDKPLYMMVWNASKMQEVLSGLSIEVEGYKDRLSLADHKLVVTFMNFNEGIEGVTLHHFHGGASDAFVYGAYLDEETGTIHLAMRAARFASAGFHDSNQEEFAYVGQGLIPAIAELAGIDDGFLLNNFYEDTAYDDYSTFDDIKGMTWYLHPGVGNPYGGFGINYLNMEYYRLLHEQGWIPPEVWKMMP